MSSKFHEANDSGHDFDLLFILYYLCVLYPTRSGCKGKKYPNKNEFPRWSLTCHIHVEIKTNISWCGPPYCR